MDKVMEMGDDESVSSGGFHDPLDPNLKEEQKVESSDESPRPSLLDKLLGSDSEDDVCFFFNSDGMGRDWESCPGWSLTVFSHLSGDLLGDSKNVGGEA